MNTLCEVRLVPARRAPAVAGRVGSFPWLLRTCLTHLASGLIDSCITQLEAQGPSRTCNESQEQKKRRAWELRFRVWCLWRRVHGALAHLPQPSSFRVLGLGFRVSGLGCQVSGFGFRVQGFGFRVSGLGSRVSGLGFRASGLGSRVSDLGSQVSGLGFRVSGFGFWASGSGVQVSGFGFRASGSEFRGWGFGPRIPGLVFRVQGFGFRVSGLGFGVLGFGIWVSGFGFGVSGKGLGIRVVLYPLAVMASRISNGSPDSSQFLRTRMHVNRRMHSNGLVKPAVEQTWHI